MEIRSILSLLLIFLLFSCTKSVKENKATRLSKSERIYVALDPKSIDSLNNALDPSLSNYGEVKDSDFVPIYSQAGYMMDGSEQNGPFVFTSQDIIPSGTMYMPMTVRQFFETIIEKNIYSICVNKNSSDWYPISQAEIKEELKNLPASQPLPFEILIAK